jgi:putative endonuclease
MAVTPNKKQCLGNWGERQAAEFLQTKGYTILARNQRTPHGELDLIALQPEGSGISRGTLVFIEVRTRASTVLGAPELSVTETKQNHVRQSVAYYLQNNPEIAQNLDWRIDVIAIRRFDRRAPAEITHFENAFA